MLNPDDKAELVKLQGEALRCVRTDDWRTFESIAERLEHLTARWRSEKHNHGTN